MTRAGYFCNLGKKIEPGVCRFLPKLRTFFCEFLNFWGFWQMGGQLENSIFEILRI
jgi:hypothetical protein